MLLRTLLTATVLCSIAVAQQQSNYPPNMPEARVETYKSVEGTDLKVWIFEPEGHKASDSRPAIVFFFGGGWRNGTPGQFHQQAMHLAARGMVAMSADYRVLNRQGVKGHKCVQDAKSAIRWVRANAKRLGIDPNRIAAGGGSAGGHLALLLAGTVGRPDFEGEGGNPGVDTSVAAVIAVYPPVLFHVGERLSGANAATALLGADPDPGEAAAASPIETVHRDFPPTFFLHGNADRVVPVTASLNMYRRLSDVGARAEMHIYAEQPHGWARWAAWVEPTMDEAAVFLERYVVDSERYAPPDEGGQSS